MKSTRFAPLLAMCLGAAQGLALAAPYTPTRDDEIVASLPRRLAANPDDARAERAAREQLRRAPDNLALALQTARQAIDRARRDGDPRELGQAQAALAPWWQAATPPPAVRLLRAVVRQASHDFASAQADLDALLASPQAAPPELAAQARLTRASILQVQGRYAEAAADCAALGRDFARFGAAALVPARACGAELASLQGRADAAQAQLDALAREAGPAYAGWLALMRAELAERRGDARAEALYREALVSQADVYTQAAFADWLLDHGRPREVIDLLVGREDADALLLRLAIAYRAAQDPRAATAAATLRARFDEARLRGDTTHGREASRFALAIDGDAARALELAQRNWAVQKEPADARVLAEAARAAKATQAAEPLRRFLRETGLLDVRVQRSLS